MKLKWKTHDLLAPMKMWSAVKGSKQFLITYVSMWPTYGYRCSWQDISLAIRSAQHFGDGFETLELAKAACEAKLREITQ